MQFVVFKEFTANDVPGTFVRKGSKGILTKIDEDGDVQVEFEHLADKTWAHAAPGPEYSDSHKPSQWTRSTPGRVTGLWPCRPAH